MRILLLIILTFSIFNLAFATSKVEDVFLDIKSDYNYLEELQSLYDKNMIFPDSNGNFNPQSLLKRDEFVGTSMELVCEKCIQPKTSYNLKEKYYKTDIFYDLSNNNKYFYCIADAKDKQITKGYSLGHICEDGTSKNGESPFCSNNNIKLEEAVAVLIRNSGLLTIEENNLIKSQIESGSISNCLSEDICPLNEDGSVYTFYGYFKKALEFEQDGITPDGSSVTYKILNKNSDNKLYPSKNITREEYLKMAHVISLSSPCFNEDGENGFSLDINYKKNNGVYDFEGIYGGTCSLGVEKYRWDFYNYDTGDIDVKFGYSLDDYNFISDGKWLVTLSIEDKCLEVGTIYNSFIINNGGINNELLDVSIDATTIKGVGPLNINFNSIVNGCNNDCIYNWTFGDGNTSNNENPSNYFLDNGIYEVILKVVKDNGNTGKASILIDINDGIFDPNLFDNTDGDGINDEFLNPNLFNDTDGDGINDYLEGLFDGDLGSDGSCIGDTDIVFTSGNKIGCNIECSEGGDECPEGSFCGVYSEKYNGLICSSNGDTDGDGIYDNEDNCPLEGGLVYQVSKGLKGCKIPCVDNDNCIKFGGSCFKEGGGNGYCTFDSDLDGVGDINDKCVGVFGDIKNEGCPILLDPCSNKCSCKTGFICSLKLGDVSPGECTKNGLCIPNDGCAIDSDCINGYKCIGATNEGLKDGECVLVDSCVLDNKKSYIYGNAICDTCPCNNYLDFDANLRKCDLVFPAITSTDGKELFSRGKIWQMGKGFIE